MSDRRPGEIAPLPDPLGQAMLEAEPEGATTRRAFAYGALGLLLAGALGTRLAGVSATAPGSGPPGGDGAGELIAVLASLHPDAALLALDQAPFTAAERARLAPMLRDRRAHLVAAPLFGIGASVGAGLMVDCGLLRRRIVLGAGPVPVLLPIARAGRITLTPIAPHGTTTMGIVVVPGPTALPPIPPGAAASLDVIVD